MTQREVELILVRQLTSYLTTPMLVVGTTGSLLYFNEAAEPFLGRRFEETDDLREVDLTGPLTTALMEQRPATGPAQVLGREVEVTAFPLLGQGGRALGAVAMFWQSP